MHPDFSGHLNKSPSHFLPLALSSLMSLSLSLNNFSLSISTVTHNSVEDEVRIRPKCRVVSTAWLSCPVHRGNKVCGVEEREKQNRNPLHFTRLSLPFSSLCTLTCGKRIAERMSARRRWEKTDGYPCFASPVTLQCAWLITNSKNMHVPGVAFQIACTSECDLKGVSLCSGLLPINVMLWEYHIGIQQFNAGQRQHFALPMEMVWLGVWCIWMWFRGSYCGP